jgi:uncharacterized RDD family membrane protein YckC
MTGISMTDQPAGWYRDPLPANPDSPETERFWDGKNWTGQVRMGSRKQRAAWREELVAERRAHARTLVERADAGDAEAVRELMGPVESGGTRAATADGDLLSGWWRRVFAYWIDSTLVNVLATVFSWRFLQQIAEAMSSYTDRAVRASETGAPAPPVGPLVDTLTGPMLGILAVFTGLWFVYEVGFLKAFQGTPGKLLLGLEVRLSSTPGPLPWGALLLRYFAKIGVGLLSWVPFAVLLVCVYAVLDALWPLWDPRRQALHDKAARTQVVRRRG